MTNITSSANATPLPAPPPSRRSAAHRPPPSHAVLRRRLEAAADRIIRALDALDAPGEDLEEGHDAEDVEQYEGDDDPDAEPSLGANEGRCGTFWEGGGADDLEPSLGFLEMQPSLTPYVCAGEEDQSRICQGLPADLEDEHDGAEPDDGDREPSLGAIDRIDQTAWAESAIDDCEQDAGEEGELVYEDDEGFVGKHEVSAVIRGHDGCETIVRRIVDTPFAATLQTIHNSSSSGSELWQLLIRQVRS